MLVSSELTLRQLKQHLINLTTLQSPLPRNSPNIPTSPNNPNNPKPGEFTLYKMDIIMNEPLKPYLNESLYLSHPSLDLISNHSGGGPDGIGICLEQSPLPLRGAINLQVSLFSDPLHNNFPNVQVKNNNNNNSKMILFKCSHYWTLKFLKEMLYNHGCDNPDNPDNPGSMNMFREAGAQSPQHLRS